MLVNNILEEKSFQFTEDKPSMISRSSEIADLNDIVDYCNSIQEKVEYTYDLYDVYVQRDVTLVDCLYAGIGDIKEDDKRLIMEMLEKKCNSKLNEAYEKSIMISLGEYQGCAHNYSMYLEERRNILSKCSKASEYEAFMHSCFPNSCFAKNILSEMKYIKNFSENAKEITDCLSFLDDEAITLYKKYRTDLKTAMDIISGKLRKCSPESSSHLSEVLFTFEYDECLNGENIAREKEVECSPHLKLIRGDSNLRIYFQWCDKDVGEGEKVLIGRIGRHPY